MSFVDQYFPVILAVVVLIWILKSVFGGKGSGSSRGSNSSGSTTPPVPPKSDGSGQ